MAKGNKFNMPEPSNPAEKKSVAKAIIAKGPEKQSGISGNPKGPGKLRHIHIEPAANGFMVRSSHETPPSSDSKGGAVPYDHGDKQHVFTDGKSALKHAAKVMGCDDEEGEYA